MTLLIILLIVMIYCIILQLHNRYHNLMRLRGHLIQWRLASRLSLTSHDNVKAVFFLSDNQLIQLNDIIKYNNLYEAIQLTKKYYK